MSTNESQLRLTPGISKPIKDPSPSFQLVILASLIFLAEIVAMVIIYYIETPHYLAKTLLDALIMLALLIPGLYYLQLKPLLKQIRERTRVEQAVWRAWRFAATVSASNSRYRPGRQTPVASAGCAGTPR